jgi:hypothetical protein
MNQEQRDRATEEKIDRERLGRALATTAGFLAEGGHPEWENPEQVSAWVTELRSLDSDASERKRDPHG